MRLHKSTNSGINFTQGWEFSPSGFGQADYNMVLNVNPHNPHYVYFGLMLLYISSDGGTTFGTYSPGHVDIHRLDFHPTDANKLIIGNDGGMFKSDNYGVS
ncbi:MAG: hypothetical protein ACRDFC_02890, partial [Ignavibacteria bacterium]